MKFEVTYENNFLRVLQLPKVFPPGFCFSGGYPVEFKVVDWFNPIPQMETFPKILEGKELDETRENLKKFISQKMYIVPGCKYIAITEYGDSFMIGG